MDRYAPGVVPGVDISSLNLHAVRETANGAFLDLQDGNVDRAVTALRNVLALQYPVSDRPWSATFPTSAEQPEPRCGRAPPRRWAIQTVARRSDGQRTRR